MGKLSGRLTRVVLLLLACSAPPASAASPPLAGAVWWIAGEPLQWRADRGFAGAISSIRFRGREFLDAADHGRELQGAVQFGSGECLNPTLAGASGDPPDLSSSQLLVAHASAGRYFASTRMAFWNRPGAHCTLAPGVRSVALNQGAVSDLVYSQDMSPGYMGHPNAILTRIALFSAHLRPPASVEALTGYMPPDFDTFSYDAQTGKFVEDDAFGLGTEEQEGPLVLSTRDGRSAMGVIGLSGGATPYYAGFHSANVGKWSLVYHQAGPFAPGVHRYTCVWVIGTRREVEDALADIVRRTASRTILEEALLGAAAAGALILGGALLAERERRRRSRPLLPL